MSKVRPGLHVALEGIDGCGKSTVLHALKDRFSSSTYSWSTAKYTDKSRGIGRLVSTLYGTPKLTPSALLILRSQRWIQALLYGLNGRRNLRRARKDVDILLADRSIVCSYASHWGLLPVWYLDVIESSRAPDLVVLLDIEPQEAEQRLRHRGDQGYEEDLDSLKLFQCQYENLMAHPPKRLNSVTFMRCAAAGSADDVADKVFNIICAYFATAGRYRTSAS